MEDKGDKSFLQSFVDDCLEETFTEDTNEDILEELSSRHPRYENRELIDQGGMKKILSSYDRITARDVALANKISEKSDLANFVREARITAKLEHPNIVPIYDIGSKNGEVFFIMKKLSGENLQAIIQRLEKNDPTTLKNYPRSYLLEIFLKVCDAISFAHSKRVLHLDIKPANIQVDEYGQVLVCDWGLARDASDEMLDDDSQSDEKISLDLSNNNRIAGTPGYMAPEQVNRSWGKRGQCTDIYSLGALLYTILTYKKAISGRSVDDVIQRTISGDIMAPRKRSPHLAIPPALEAVAMKAMSLNTDDRYASTQQLATEIRAYLNGFSTDAEQAGFLREVKLLIKRNKKIAQLAILSIFTLSLITIFFINNLRLEKNIALKAKEDEALMRAQAENSELAAKESEHKALGLVDALNQKEAKVLKTRQESARNLMQNAFLPAFKTRRYFTAYNILVSIHKLDPDLQDAIYYLAKLQIGQLQFPQAEAYLKTYKGERDISWMLDFCANFKDTSGKWDVVLDWRKVHHAKQELGGIPQHKLEGVRRHITEGLAKKLTTEEHLKFAQLSLEARSITPMYFKVTREGNSIGISLRGSKLAPYDELQYLHIDEFDLSHTDIPNLYNLRQIKIKKLDVSHTPVNSLKFLHNTRLEELNIQGTKVNNLKGFYNSPIHTLRLNGEFQNLNFLKNFSHLKVLEVPKNIYDLTYIQELKPELKIIED